MSEDEIREALQEYRRWLLEAMGNDLFEVLAEREHVTPYMRMRVAQLREVNALLKRDDLIRTTAERLK